MRLEVFFEKFDQLADAPNAVAKMQEFVLQLAVQGKLVEQIDSDGTADELLTVIARNLGSDASKNLLNYEPEEPPLVAIPRNWRWVPTSAICNLQTGKRMKGGAQASGVISLGGEHLKPNGTIDYTVPRYVSPEFYNEMRNGQVSLHDTLMVKDGATTGKAAFVAALPADGRAAVNEHVFILRWHAPIDKRLAFYFIRAFALRHIATKSAGLIGGIRREAVLDFPFPLPSLAEQKRIVAKVDELMALCDRLEAQQQERDTRHAALARASLARFAEAPTPANLEFLFHKSYTITPAELRKTILNLAVQGKLVPQDPNDESAKDCLSRLGLKTTFASENNSNELNNILPSSWARVRFEDIAVIAGGVTLGRKLAGRKTVALPYLRVANVKRGQIDLSIIKKVSIAENEIERYALRENDLLMTEGGDWDKVGRAAIWKAKIPICLHQNHIFRARMRSAEITPVWFERYFNSPDGRSYFEFASKQTTNLASINMRQVRGCPVLFPPLAEQRRIIAKVDQLMALVDQLETQLTTVQTQGGRLLEAIFHEILNPTVRRLNRHLARALLSAEIVHQLHAEPTFGRTKHQKILHLCECIAEIREVAGEYHRDAAGPLDNKMIYSVIKELKKQHWYEEYPREKFGNAYRPLEKAGQHRKYLERYWPDKLPVIQRLLNMMRTWDTDRCEIFSTTYAAWNDLLIWKQEPTEEAILKEILERWHEKKKRFSEERWCKEIAWMSKEGFVPTGFGRPTRYFNAI